MGSIVEGSDDVMMESISNSVVQDQEVHSGGDGDEKVKSWNSLSETKNNGGVEAHFTGSSSSGGANNSSNPARRIFTPAFKKSVLEAFITDPDCIGNQRATARKFGIHRRQVQKWLTQLGGSDKEGSPSSSEPNPNQEGSIGSSSSTLGTSPSSSEKDKREVEEPVEVQEPVAKEPQVDLSPTSSSSSPKSHQLDLSNLSSTAMAMSLNLTHNSGSNNVISNSMSMNQKQIQNHSYDRSRNSCSPTQAQSQITSISSPNSLLSRFYGLPYGHHGLSPGGTNYLKYQGLNLNGDSAKTQPVSIPTNKSIQTQHYRIRKDQRQHNSTGTQPLQILEEIAAVHPNDDFSLLRRALLRNEVSFTKVPLSAPKSTFFPPPPEKSPENNGWGNNGKDTSRTCSPPASVSPKNSSHNTLALELFRQQQEYMRLFQQSGLNFPDVSSEGHKSMTDSSKYPWLHPLAQAAASMGLPLLTNSNLNGQKKQSNSHVFVSPKPPNNSKPKTVAAALAASRTSPTLLLHPFQSGTYDAVLSAQIKKRTNGSRKRGKPKQNLRPSCTITRPSQQDDDYVDPTSILEVTTSSSSEGTNLTSNGGIGCEIGYLPSVNGGTHFLHSILQSPDELPFGNRLESPESAEMKKYLEQLTRKSPAAVEQDAEQMTKNIALEAFTFDPEVAGDCRAVARKFGLNVRVVMKWIKESTNKISHSQNKLPNHNVYDNYAMKSLINGNGDIIPDDDSPNQREEGRVKTNGDLHLNDETEPIYYQHPIPIPSSSNKRKNSKPNQICDFQKEVDYDLTFGDVPLDMMIPIKKRRVSSQE